MTNEQLDFVKTALAAIDSKLEQSREREEELSSALRRVEATLSGPVTSKWPSWLVWVVGCYLGLTALSAVALIYRVFFLA